MSSSLFDRIRSTAAWRISIWTTFAFAIGTALTFVLMFAIVKRDVQQRSDAWLGGEAEVLADVAARTPRDSLYDRLVEEVAELASKEVPDIDGSDRHPDTVFFLIQRPRQDPLWVGPTSKNAFLDGLRRAALPPARPTSVHIPGYARPFRVVMHQASDGSLLFLGFSDLAAHRMMDRIVVRFASIWCGLVMLGFAISSAGAYHALRRVELISAAVDKIGSEDLGRRLPEYKHSDEITRLSRTFNRMLDRIQKSVSQMRVLTDSVAHDLKSPVTAIRGELEVAISQNDPESWRDGIAEAIEKLDRLSQTLNTALDLAEADAGALQLKREFIRLDKLVEQFVELYTPSISERGCTLLSSVKHGMTVEADLGLLSRMITNLLDNEVAHLPQHCVVEVRLRETEHDIELVIEDDGPGFPPDVRARAFERFVKGQHSSGHGLGLAFVDAVVQAHGGNVQISERPQGGARITVIMPLARVLA